MIGICLTNAGPEMAPWGGITPIIGTNPWGLGAPTGLGFPLVLDMALSMSGKGMVRWHQREGLPVPTNWAYNAQGQETTDPTAAMDGPLVPMGMFKGTGLSIFTDVLCGVMTGAAFGGALYREPDNHDVGHMLVAIDIERFPAIRSLHRSDGCLLPGAESLRAGRWIRRGSVAWRAGTPPFG